MCKILHVKQIRSLTFYECVLLGLRSGTVKYQTHDNGVIANRPNEANARVFLQHHRDPCQCVYQHNCYLSHNVKY